MVFIWSVMWRTTPTFEYAVQSERSLPHFQEIGILFAVMCNPLHSVGMQNYRCSNDHSPNINDHCPVTWPGNQCSCETQLLCRENFIFCIRVAHNELMNHWVTDLEDVASFLELLRLSNRIYLDRTKHGNEFFLWGLHTHWICYHSALVDRIFKCGSFCYITDKWHDTPCAMCCLISKFSILLVCKWNAISRVVINFWHKMLLYTVSWTSCASKLEQQTNNRCHLCESLPSILSMSCV